MLPFAIIGRVSTEDYFSCDVPINNKPCGECADCKELKEVEDILTINHYHKALVYNNYDYLDPKFKELLSKEPIFELRMLHNNSCQLKCKHCFYGFEETKSPILAKEKLYSAIKEAAELGISNIHFSGKEPLFDDEILWYANKIKEDNLPLTFDIVTNGINVPKYAKELKDCNIKCIHLSVDDVMSSNGVRKIKGVTEKALESCCKEGIDVDIYIDLHENNFNKVSSIIKFLAERYSCVKSFYVRTIRSIGNAINIPLLDYMCILTTVEQVKECAKLYPTKSFIMSLGIEYEQVIFGYEDSDILQTMFTNLDNHFTDCYFDNLRFILEDCCKRYACQVTLTPDGYLLGCTSEVASEDYDKLSVGNIKDHPLKELIDLGKKTITPYCNDNLCDGCKKCSFLLK